MGRHVYEINTGEWIWKYSFAEQNSEQSRIAEELHVGEMEYPEPDEFYGDRLYIRKQDIQKLKEALCSNGHKKLIKEGDWKYNALVSKSGGIPMNKKWEKVRAWARKNDYWFWKMVEAYIKFMESYPETEQFAFEGEY